MSQSRTSCLSLVLVASTLLIILGAYSLGITEGLINTYATPAFWETPDIKVAWLVSPTPTATITSTATPCPMPEGWVDYQIQPDDSLDTLSQTRGFTVELVQLANCQPGVFFEPGQVIFLPAHTLTPTRTFTPTPSETPVICSHPQGWDVYIIENGDTPFSLSLKYNVGIVELQKANCLDENEDLIAGQELYLPLPATITPIPPTATITMTPLPPTITPTLTPLILRTAPPAS
jgi:LysM repeat protein